MLYFPKRIHDFIYASQSVRRLAFSAALLLLAGFMVVLWRGLRTYLRAATTLAAIWR